MALPPFVLKQLAKPSGLFGRLILNRLNKANQGMNALPLRLLPVTSSGRVLEIGFGGGALLGEILRQQPASLVGVEASDLAVKVIGNRHRKEIQRGDLELVLSDAASLPFQDNSFSRIYCVNVVYFWPEPEEVFRELRRVTAPDGRFALCYQRFGPDEGISFEPAKIEKSLIEAGFSAAETIADEDSSNGQFFCTIATRTDA